MQWCEQLLSAVIQLLLPPKIVATCWYSAELQSLLSRIQGPPNSARENLINGFSCEFLLTALVLIAAGFWLPSHKEMMLQLLFFVV